MLEKYDADVAYVLDQISKKLSGYNTLFYARKCFRELRAELVRLGCDYSPDFAISWLQKRDNLTCVTKTFYQSALNKLFFQYNGYEIPFLKTFDKQSEELTPQFRAELTEYLTHINLQDGNSYKNRRSHLCTFLIYLKSRGRNNISQITPIDAVDYLKIPHPNKMKLNISTFYTHAQAFLTYFADKHQIKHSIALLMEWRYKDFFVTEKDFTKSERKTLEALKAPSLEFPADEFYELIPQFAELMKEYGYTKGIVNTSIRALVTFFIFIDINGYGYSTELAKLWFDKTQSRFKHPVSAARKALYNFGEYVQNGDFRTDVRITSKLRRCDKLPLWCRGEIENYLAFRLREGKEPGTICADRTSVTRLCEFLVAEGVNDFNEVTPAILTKFNLTDKHDTAIGKNNYNSKIRGFITYLIDGGKISNRGLAQSLMDTSAAKARPVRTLTDEEIAKIEFFTRFAQTEKELRDAAMIQVSLKMGLRGSDIIKLLISDIDWHNRTIRFIQQKTKVEKLHPMPVSAGNALYRYIVKGRPECNSPFVFLSIKRHKKTVSKGVLSNLLSTILKTEGKYGFHILRKTFATNMLKGGAAVDTVADALGHQNNENVHVYLSGDDRLMRTCALSFSDAGITSFVTEGV